MPFTTKLTLTFLALALLALAHGHSTGTNQRASPPAPRRVFLVIEHLALYTTYPPPPTQRALLLYNEPLPHTTLLSTPRRP